MALIKLSLGSNMGNSLKPGTLTGSGTGSVTVTGNWERNGLQYRNRPSRRPLEGVVVSFMATGDGSGAVLRWC